MNDPAPTGGMSQRSASIGTLSQGGDTVSSQEGSGTTVVETNVGRKWGPSWSADTHLVFTPGSNKVLLTIQPLLIRMTIQDAFDTLRATLVFENAFPDPNLTVLFIRKSLVGAARSRLPNTVNVYNRLLLDDEYMDKLIVLVSVLTVKDMLLTIS